MLAAITSHHRQQSFPKLASGIISNKKKFFFSSTLVPPCIHIRTESGKVPLEWFKVFQRQKEERLECCVTCMWYDQLLQITCAITSNDESDDNTRQAFHQPQQIPLVRLLLAAKQPGEDPFPVSPRLVRRPSLLNPRSNRLSRPTCGTTIRHCDGVHAH